MSGARKHQNTEGRDYGGYRGRATSDVLRELGVEGPVSEQQARTLMSIMELTDLEQELFARFKALGDRDDIKNAIRCGRLALLLAVDNQKLRVELLNALGNAYRSRFEHDGELSDINKAIDHHVQALMCTSNGFEGKPGLLQPLGDSCLARFRRTGEIADINKAIACYEQAVRLVSHTDPRKQGMVSNCGGMYMARFEFFGQLGDLEKAIDRYAQAVLLTPDDHENKPDWLNNLGNAYLGRYDHRGELADIESAVHCHSQAVLSTPDSHMDKPARLRTLGDSYLVRFEQSGKLADVNKAIEYQTQAALLSSDHHNFSAVGLRSLGNSYLERFKRTREVADIDKSIEYYSQAMFLSPERQTDKPAQLSSFRGSYLARPEHDGQISGTGKAIEYRAQDMLFNCEKHNDKAAGLNALGNAYLTRFEHLGMVTDIDKAIDYHSQAVSLSSESRADKPAKLNNLGIAYMHRFERLGRLEDIDKAIYYQCQAALLTSDSHTDKPTWLTNLGNSYTTRFKRLGEVADLDKAMECHSQAVQLTPDSFPSKPSLLNNLGTCYSMRFASLGELTDCNSAIRCHDQAVLLTADDHPTKPSRLHNLGASYAHRFRHNGEVADVNTAIEYQTQIVMLTHDEDADKPLWLSSLGSSYLARFEHNKEVADLDEAINYQSQAALFTPDDHADKPGRLESLGKSYILRFKCLRNYTDIEIACQSFAHAAQLDTGDPRNRYAAARRWTRFLCMFDISPEPAYRRTMELLPELVWLGSTIDQRYDRLIQLGDVVTEAASSAISLHMLDCALEWLEQGRSIVWNQILQLRTSFDDLSEVDPVLAEGLRAAGRALESSGSRSMAWKSSLTDMSDPEQEAQDRRHWAAEWNQLLEAARLIPGFDNLMSARKVTNLIDAAKDGPVVVINVHSSRCDALIILPNREHVAHVPLEDFSPEKAAEARAQLRSVIGHRGARDGGFKRNKPVSRPDDTFKAMLATLWSDVVKPILEFLGFMHTPPMEELPHVTWCTTGALSFIPLHAAGCYDGSQPNTFDLVVSSYTPTLSALLAATPATSEPHSGILAVGQEYTKGMTSLPYTVQELAAIRELAKEVRYSQLTNENATVDAVIASMDKHDWVHLACHATQNTTDPSQSAFHLRDGSLLLSEITKRSFKNKGLAFLSACQTATGDEKLPDEAVHLAAGMLMAGYPSVIATMWSINDKDAPEVARRVYAELLQDGKMDHTRASRALHKAVAGLREKIGEQSFQQWVPFIHIGS